MDKRRKRIRTKTKRNSKDAKNDTGREDRSTWYLRSTLRITQEFRRLRNTTPMELDTIFRTYQQKFQNRAEVLPNNEPDILMEVFGITSEQKQKNLQYWHRELGMCWQKVVIEFFREHPEYSGPIKNGSEEPCDLVLGKYSIDTKYRIGSGDSGTLKKFRENAEYLRGEGYTPLLLVLREDNLIRSVKGWEMLTGKETMKFIEEHSGKKFENILRTYQKKFQV